MMKILLPVRLLFLLGDEEYNWFYLVAGCFIIRLISCMGIVGGYRRVRFIFVDRISISLILLTF